ncbi:SAM-dependent methyltransferase [Actinotalea solisilvae]|uniref:SAM-dependent methyltransferase n=1 Tax=Actinotalea solisilvae TaxID=2072922 RepID=UPI0018F20B49|nr:class I SAM-dependent methyltransferase [Actinotalea solisilvae]
MPARVDRAVALLDPAPDARVLEVGFGPGASLGLLCARVPRGHVTGLDRSPVAVTRALAAHRALVEGGRLTVRHGGLGDGDGLDGSGPFDRVLAVNVNVFWTTPAVAEVARLRELLAPDGVVLLVYEVPGDATGHRSGPLAARALTDGGLAAELVPADGLVGVRAHHG